MCSLHCSWLLLTESVEMRTIVRTSDTTILLLYCKFLEASRVLQNSHVPMSILQCCICTCPWSGLSTALLEKFDFASGTSSRSTKLIHGGVRYLQKAILGLDLEQFRMVTEALAERANLIEIAPHLAYPIPIMLPVYK